MSQGKTKTMTIVGLMTALTCILAPVSIAIPISPVPISLATLAIYFSVYVLGGKRGTISCVIYLLIGFAGLPVFSSFTGGVGKLLGPTGGYMIGYVFMALIFGFFIDRWATKYVLHIVGMVLGTIVCYLLGTVWLSIQAQISFYAALGVGVLPFIPGDIVKMIIAMAAGLAVRKRLRKAGLE